MNRTCVATPKSELLHFTLQGLLPDGTILAINRHLCVVTLMSKGPTVLHQEQLTDGELAVFLPLIDFYPHYCPLEVLLASFQYNKTDDDTVAICREYIMKAAEDGCYDMSLRPLRNVLSRARLKINRFELVKIISVMETGYMISPIRRN